jgi:predicted nucleotidyltransferase
MHATPPGAQVVATRVVAGDPWRMLSEAEISRVVELLERRFGLDALLVFGSEASGATHRESDLDLAALLRRRPEALELIDAQTAIEGIVGRSVDLVDLGRASPILAMQVLRGGRCVFGREAPALLSFEALLPSRYADLKRVRAEAESALVQRVVDGRS